MILLFWDFVGSNRIEQILTETRRLNVIVQQVSKKYARQLKEEDREARRLRGTSLDDYEVIQAIGRSKTITRGRYGCNSIVYQAKYSLSEGFGDLLF